MSGRRARALARAVRSVALAALLSHAGAPGDARADCRPRGLLGTIGGEAESANRLLVQDLDGDGVPDLVLSPTDGEDVIVRRGLVRADGSVIFPRATPFALGALPLALAAGDWDGDGVMDLAVSTVDHHVVILAGHGRGGAWGMSVVQRCPAPDIPLYVTAGDLDGDGRPDLATTDGSGFAVHVYPNRGDGTFAGPQDYPVEGLAAQLRMADVNRDGLPDLVIAMVVPSGIEVLLGNGGSAVARTILKPAQMFRQSGVPGLLGLQIGDVDGDGDLDAVATFAGASSTRDGAFQIWRGRFDNGRYAITPSTPVHTFVPAAVSGLELGDFDGDHQLDFALIFDSSGPTIPAAAIFYGDGARNLAGPYTIAGPLHGTDLVATDVDGDGATDVALVGQSGGWFVNRGNCPPPPAVDRFAPPAGAIGDTVDVFGRGLDQVSAASLGGAAAGIVSQTPRRLTLRVPDAAVSGPIVLATAGGPIATPESFAVGTGPAVLAFAPSRGKSGQTIAVRGAHLSGATAVSIGGHAAERFGVPADTLLEAVADTVDEGGVVIVTTPFGSDTSATAFEMAPPDTAPQRVTVSDVPGDQGGRVLVSWTASDFDRTGRGRIQAYRVLRRAPAAPAVPAPAGAGRTGAARTPDGWEEIATLPIARRDAYSVVATTRGDSTAGDAAPETFEVDALGADGTVYPSPPGSGSSVDNLPPAAVRALTARRSGSHVELAWSAASDPDLAGYAVYAGDVPGFATTPGRRIAFVAEPRYAADATATDSCFRVVAVDTHGNAAPAVDAVIGGWLPVRFDLLALAPMPVRGALTVELALPAAGGVRLEALDIAGRRVLDETVAFDRPGIQRHAWAGFATLRQGVYFVRVRQGAATRTARAVVAR